MGKELKEIKNLLKMAKDYEKEGKTTKSYFLYFRALKGAAKAMKKSEENVEKILEEFANENKFGLNQDLLDDLEATYSNILDAKKISKEELKKLKNVIKKVEDEILKK